MAGLAPEVTTGLFWQTCQKSRSNRENLAFNECRRKESGLLREQGASSERQRLTERENGVMIKKFPSIGFIAHLTTNNSQTKDAACTRRDARRCLCSWRQPENGGQDSQAFSRSGDLRLGV